jgi:hypothetical protein
MFTTNLPASMPQTQAYIDMLHCSRSVNRELTEGRPGYPFERALHFSPEQLPLERGLSRRNRRLPEFFWQGRVWLSLLFGRHLDSLMPRPAPTPLFQCMEGPSSAGGPHVAHAQCRQGSRRRKASVVAGVVMNPRAGSAGHVAKSPTSPKLQTRVPRRSNSLTSLPAQPTGFLSLPVRFAGRCVAWRHSARSPQTAAHTAVPSDPGLPPDAWLKSNS